MSAGPFFFSHFVLDPRQIFVYTPLCLGFVNIRPAVLGHVLLTPKRVTPRFRDMTSDELTDFIHASHKIARALEILYSVSSLTMTIQDGPEAGQTVSHVHMHLLPRRHGDFKHNDQVYDAIDKSTLPSPPAARTIDEMAVEADRLRELLEHLEH